MRKHNDGFTLVELVVTIVVAGMVTLAATTFLLMGLRMNKASSETAQSQNTARIVLTVLEDLAQEESITIEGNTDSWKVKNASDRVLFSYYNKGIYVGSYADTSAAPLMDGLESATVSWADGKEDLLTITLTTATGETYTSSVYCRLAVPETMDESVITIAAEAPASAVSSSKAMPEPDFTGLHGAAGRQAFLDVLTAELGSTGKSLTTGEYFSEWYIGGYEGHPGWNADTPWCACFVSWALDQCREYLYKVPKFAHVDPLKNEFGLANWKTGDPRSGDLIFFDWNPDTISYAQHVGVVLSCDGQQVWTIEGNADGIVDMRRYSLDNHNILGYGVLSWNNEAENEEP